MRIFLFSLCCGPLCLLLSVHSKLKSHGLVAVCPDFPSFTILVQRGPTALRRKELCFSWPRAHEEKEECFSTGDSTGAKYSNRWYRRSFQSHLKTETKTESMADLKQLMDNEVLMAFASYATIILTKMMLMSSATAFQRITNKVFANPEDGASFSKGENAKKFVRTDEKVERVRRAHLNDLENIVPFLGIGLLYSLSGPDLSSALMHFRIFVGARIYHTIAYLTPLPQPNRGLAFFVGYGVTLSMAYRLLRSRLYL